jgi:hypothetical protein
MDRNCKIKLMPTELAIGQLAVEGATHSYHTASQSTQQEILHL